MKKRAQLSDGRVIEYVHKDKPPAGGMKKVYFTPDKKYALCFYKDPNAGRDSNRIARIQSIIGKYNPTVLRSKGGAAPDQKSADYYSQLFCWPVAIIEKPSLGILTPTYRKNFFFKSGKLKGKDKNGKWFSNQKLRKFLPPKELGDWYGYFSLCMRMARALAKLHVTGLAHSDLSNNNVLVDPLTGQCSVIDIDSLVVPGRFPPDVLGTPGYIAPEVIKTRSLPPGDKNRVLPSNWTDLFALGVLVYEYLLKRHPLRGPKIHDTTSAENDERLAMGEKALFIEDPKDRSNRPGPDKKTLGFQKELSVTIDQLGPFLARCFTKTFVEGLHHPKKRAVATRWLDAFVKTEDLLLKCGNSACKEKWFVFRGGGSCDCPWCGWRPSVPVPYLEFFYSPMPGQFRSENRGMVGYDGREVREWHVFSSERLDETADHKALARFTFHKNQWLLQNLALDSMLSPSGNPVAYNQYIALKDGDEILLSRSTKGRLVKVKYVR